MNDFINSNQLIVHRNSIQWVIMAVEKQIRHLLRTLARMWNIISIRVHWNTRRLQAWLIAYQLRWGVITSITSVNRKILLSTTWQSLCETWEVTPVYKSYITLQHISYNWSIVFKDIIPWSCSGNSGDINELRRYNWRGLNDIKERTLQTATAWSVHSLICCN